MNSAAKKLLDYFQRLDSKKRKALTLFGAAATVLLLAWLAVMVTSKGGGKSLIQERKPEYTLLANHNPREVSVEALSGRVKKIEEGFGDIKEEFGRTNEKLKTVTDMLNAKSQELQRQSERLDAQTKSLAAELDKTQESLALPLPSLEGPGKKNTIGRASAPSPEPRPLAGQPTPPAVANGDNKPESAPKLKIVTLSGKPANQNAAKDGRRPDSETIKKVSQTVTDKDGKKRTEIYIPAGSIMSGTLITGLDAPSSNQARRDPFPVLLRIKHDTILPNRFRMDFRECFLISGGYGDMSSERAYLRAELLSCVKTDGTVIETPVDGFAVGEDGKAGIRGRLVSKNGQLIANSLLAGFVTGISQAFVPQRVQSLNLTNQSGVSAPYQYPSPEMIAGQGIAGGVRGASQQIAMYYMDMARNIFPVVEIDAGRKIDFVLIRGAGLDKKGTGSGSRSGNAAASGAGFGSMTPGPSQMPSNVGLTGNMGGMNGNMGYPGGYGNSYGSGFNNNAGYGR